MKQVSQELVGGYNLNARLLELLGHPLDSRGQGEAMSICQELSRVFMVSLFMLRPDDGGAEEVRSTAPEVRKDDGGIGRLLTPAKDKRISCGEGAGQLRNGRQEDVTRREITPSPHKDGYRWRKYGQKIIRNTKFERYYFRCALSRDRRCKAKKQVQEQDSSSDPPVFEVTYLHEHTCQRALPDEDGTASLAPATAPASSIGNGASSDPSQGGSIDVEVNEAIVSCLAMVISGAAPPSSSLSLPPPPPPAVEAYLQAGGYHSPILDGSMAAETDHFSRSSYHPSSLYCPVEAAADHQLVNHCDVHPADTASAWTYRGYVMWK